MTAEVAVLNKSGVAMAADSAVTTGFPGREKIFTTANKIFTLSKIHPVGIMINGHVEHFGCPWEVIIKDFRTRIGSQRFDDLRQYVDLFIETVKDKRFLTDDGQAVSVLVTGLSTLGELERRIRESDLKWNAPSIKKTLENMITDAGTQLSVPGFENIKQRMFDTEYGAMLKEISTHEKYVEDKRLPKACFNTFKLAVFSAITRQMSTQFNTGLVIAGYGHSNLYPKLFEIAVDGGFLDSVRCYDVDSCDISKEPEGAAISTFAQDDIVQAFLNGIDERFKIFHTGMFTHLMQLVAAEVLREHSNLSTDERKVAISMIEKRISETFEDFNKESISFANREFKKPVLEVLRTAPRETLAELAESLVSLTSLRQRVSGELETVGGPVDVGPYLQGRRVHLDKAQTLL